MEYQKIYLSGPMRGYRNFNHEAFDRAAEILRNLGHAVFNPADEDRAKGVAHESGKLEDIEAQGFDLREALKKSLCWILEEATVLVLLPGHHHSSGSRAEWTSAKAVGIPVMELDEFLCYGITGQPQEPDE